MILSQHLNKGSSEKMSPYLLYFLIFRNIDLMLIVGLNKGNIGDMLRGAL